MSDAECIDDRGEAGPEDNAEWLRWAADEYASAVAEGGCYAPEPDWDVDSISPGLLEAAAEIERLRARVKVLERDDRLPRPPEELVGALNDRIHPTSGRLIHSSPIAPPTQEAKP
jgi:hypothetical protein